MSSGNISTHLRIIGALARKDLVDAIRNRTVLAILLGTCMVLLTGHMMPLLDSLQDAPPRVIIWDQGNPGLVSALRRADGITAVRVRSQAELERLVATDSYESLGIALPAGLAERTNNPITLTALAPHWGDATKIEAIRVAAATTLSDALATAVRIDASETAYPPLDGGGFAGLIAMNMILGVLTVCLAVVPHLMLEEKETRTMHALLVSPAQMIDVALGKALVGVFYAAIMATALLALDQRYIVHWGWAIVAVLAGTLFTALLGLWFGVLFDNPQQMSIWVTIPLVLLLLPLVLTRVAGLQGWVVTAMSYLPTAAAGDLFLASMAAEMPLGLALAKLGIILGWTILVLGILLWTMRWLRR